MAAPPLVPIRGFPPRSIGNRIESKYLCSHCQHILRNPVQSYCGHRYCRTCVQQLLTGVESVKCQPCVQEHNEEEDIRMDTVFPDNATKRELYALPAHCPNDGCPWNGTLKLLEQHESVCELRKEECECGGLFRPEDFMAHRRNSCPHRLVNCQHCKATIQFRNTQAHKAECPRFPIQCPRCGDEGILRMALEAHMKTPVCKPRVRCPYGCGVMVEEALIDEHVNTQVRVHLDAMGTRIQSITERFDQQIVGVNEAINNLSAATCGGATGGVDDEVAMETGEAGGDLISRFDALDQKVTVSENFGIVLKREITKAARSIEAANSERAADHDRIALLEEQMRRLLHRGVPSSGSSPVPDMPISTDGTLLWQIPDFQRKRQEAASGGQVVLTSQPFYTSATGYKLCARIYPNGDGVGKTSHVSVFLIVMKGPYDGLLRWPFRQKVTMSLQDQGPRKNHIVDSFRPDPASGSFQRPTSEMNTASGCPMFATQQAIGQVGEFQYIKEGQVFLRVTVDTTGI